MINEQFVECRDFYHAGSKKIVSARSRDSSQVLGTAGKKSEARHLSTGLIATLGETRMAGLKSAPSFGRENLWFIDLGSLGE